MLAVLGRGRRARPRPATGRTLVEAHTYRIEAHTNADDATRYREDAEVDGLASTATRSPGCEAYLRAQRRCSTTPPVAAVAEEAERLAARRCATG